MWFHIDRVSFIDGAPCEGAVRKSFVRVDRRTTDDPMKNSCIGAKWYAEGRNHRVVNGQIERDFDAEGWFIEVNSLDDLIALFRREGQLIIMEPYGTMPGTLGIEIYDGYRE